MTADYNGWNDGPEAEREAIDEYIRQEFEREAPVELAGLQNSALQLRMDVRVRRSDGHGSQRNMRNQATQGER